MTEPFAPSKENLASPAKRLGGFVIDLLILTAIALVAVPITGVDLTDPASLSNSSGFRIINLVIAGVYSVAFVAARGQTPGKMLVATRVVDASTYRIPSLSAATVRYLVPSAASLVPVIGGWLGILVYAWLLWDPKRQGIHDKAANTLVVDVARQNAR